MELDCGTRRPTRNPLGALSAHERNRTGASTPFSPKPQSLRFRELLSHSTADPSWARRVRTALCGAEQTLLQEFASELTSILSTLFFSCEPSADLFALVTHVLAYGGSGVDKPWLDALLPRFIVCDMRDLAASLKIVLLNGHPSVTEKMLTCLMLSAKSPACPLHTQAAAAESIEALLFAWPDAALRQHAVSISDALIALSCVTSRCVREPWVRAVRAAEQRQSSDSDSEWNAVAINLLDACPRVDGSHQFPHPVTPNQLLERSPGITPSTCGASLKAKPTSQCLSSHASTPTSEISACSAGSCRQLLGGDDVHTGLTPKLQELSLVSPPLWNRLTSISLSPQTLQVLSEESMGRSPDVKLARDAPHAPSLMAKRCIALLSGLLVGMLLCGSNFMSGFASESRAVQRDLFLNSAADEKRVQDPAITLIGFTQNESRLVGFKSTLAIDLEADTCDDPILHQDPISMPCPYYSHAVSQIPQITRMQMDVDERNGDVQATSPTPFYTKIAGCVPSPVLAANTSIVPMQSLTWELPHSPCAELLPHPQSMCTKELTFPIGGVTGQSNPVAMGTETNSSILAASGASYSVSTPLVLWLKRHVFPTAHAHSVQSSVFLLSRTPTRLVWSPATPRCPAKCGLLPNNRSLEFSARVGHAVAEDATNANQTSKSMLDIKTLPSPINSRTYGYSLDSAHVLLPPTSPTCDALTIAVLMDAAQSTPTVKLPPGLSTAVGLPYQMHLPYHGLSRALIVWRGQIVHWAIDNSPPEYPSSDGPLALSVTQSSFALVSATHWYLILRTAHGSFRYTIKSNMLIEPFMQSVNAQATFLRSMLDDTKVMSFASTLLIHHAAGLADMDAGLKSINMPRPMPVASAPEVDGPQDTVSRVVESPDAGNSSSLERWEALLEAFARAMLASRLLLQLVMVVGTILSVAFAFHMQVADITTLDVDIAPSVAQTPHRVEDGLAVTNALKAQGFDLPASPQQSAAALLRQVSMQTPKQVCPMADEMDSLAESGHCALRALAGYTPPRLNDLVEGAQVKAMEITT